MARIAGTTGNETLTGTTEADSFVFWQYSGDDIVEDFDLDNDIIDLSHFGRMIAWDGLKEKITTVTDPDDPETVTGVLIDLTEWGGGTITLNGVTSVDALTKDMFSMPEVHVTNGTGGADVLVGQNRMDKMFGGADGDILNGQGGDDWLYGGAGMDLVLGGRGDDTLYGDAGNDTLSGHSGDDTLYGGADDDTLDGGAGADRLIGGLGDDTLYGDFCGPNAQDEDIFVYAPGHGADTIKDFQDGLDKIDLSEFTDISGFSNLSATQDGDNVVIDFSSWGGSGNSITIENFDIADLDGSDFIFYEPPPDGG